MIKMLKRLNCYFKEMYPIIPRLILGAIVFAEVYFLLLLNYGVDTSTITIGIPEAVGAFTIFSFLLMLRIADDFKDYECEFTGYSNNESIRFTKYALNCEFELNDFKVTKITDYVYDYNEICNYVNTEGKIIYSKSLDIVLVVRIKK